MSAKPNAQNIIHITKRHTKILLHIDPNFFNTIPCVRVKNFKKRTTTWKFSAVSMRATYVPNREWNMISLHLPSVYG